MSKAKGKKRSTVDEIKTREISLPLPVTLTDERWRQIAQEVGALAQELKRVQAAKVGAMSAFKEQIADVEQRLTAMTGTLSSGYENLIVKCEETIDYGQGVYKVVRLDIGEIVVDRRLTAQEMQTGLDLRSESAPQPDSEPDAGEEGDEG